MQIRERRPSRLKKFISGITRFGWAAIALVLVVFVVGACTIGGFSSSGDTYFARKNAQIVFYLDYSAAGGEQLEKIYVNVGSVYEEAGKEFSLTFARCRGSSGSTFTTSSLGKVTFSNMIPSEDSVGTNYNWVEAVDLTGRQFTTSYNLIRVEVSAEMFLNEVVFVNTEGEVIPAYAAESDVKGFFSEADWPSFRDYFHTNDTVSDLGALGDPAALTDASDRFVTGSTAYTNYMQDEMYTLLQLDGLRMKGLTTDGTFYADTDFGPLSVLFPALGTLIFGVCPFGLRIFPVLFTAALVAVCYLLGKELFKNNGFAFLFACFAAFGGLALTVGRLGAAYSLIALLLVSSLYFLFRYFAGGISQERPLRSAANVLYAGLLFALAVAADPKCLFALIVPVALFAAGWVRQRREQKQTLSVLRAQLLERNAAEKSEEAMQANIEEFDARESSLRAGYGYANRVVWVFFLVSFFVASALFVLLSALPSYYIYLKLYEADPSSPTLGLFGLVWAAVKDTFTVADVTQFSAANAVNPFGWFLSLKGATLYAAGGEGTYIALNAQFNLALAVTSLVGFVFMTSYAVLYAATGGRKGAYASEHSPRLLNAYFLLLAGLAACLLQYLFAGQTSAAQSFAFTVFYGGFGVLMFATAFAHDGSAVKKVLGIPMNNTLKVLAGMCAVYVLLFLLSLPMVFCIPVSDLAASICFGWTTFLNNGYYRP